MAGRQLQTGGLLALSFGCVVLCRLLLPDLPLPSPSLPLPTNQPLAQISRRCYNQFKKHLKDSPTFKKEAKEFFAECDAKVPDLKFDEEKPKIEKVRRRSCAGWALFKRFEAGLKTG